MIKQLKALMIIMIFNSLLIAQAPDTMWIKTFGHSGDDVGKSIKQTTDNGFMIAGTLRDSEDNYAVYLVKTDAVGDTTWTRKIGGDADSSSSNGWSVLQTTDGGYVVVGGTRSEVHSLNDYDLYIVKTNQNGDVQWKKAYGNLLSDIGSCIYQADDGGFIIVGTHQLINHNSTDIWLIKTDSNGDTLWTKTFGGDQSDIGNAVVQSDDGGYIIAANTYSFGAGGRDILLIKTNANGDSLWAKTFGDSDQDAAYDIQKTLDDNFIVAGSITNPGQSAYSNDYLIKINSDGDTLWTKTYSSESDFWAVGNSVYATSDGGYVICGTTYWANSDKTDIYIIKTDINGNKEWSKSSNILGYDEGYTIVQTSDEGYAVLGFYTPTGTVLSDIIFIKYSPVTTAVNEKFNNSNSGFALNQNYPNPFNPSTKIRFTVPAKSYTSLKIYDVLGNEVGTLVDEYKPAGNYNVDFDASNLSSGVYFYTLRVGNFIESKKMLLLK